MGKAAQDNRPRLRPVKKIELSEKNIKPRVFLMIFFLVLGLGALTYGLIALLSTDPGWTLIESDNAGRDGSEEITFQYCIGQAENMSNKAELKALTQLYTQEVGKINQLLSIYEDATGNLYRVNQQINQETEVDPALYRVLEQIDRSGSRILFAAPYYTTYRNLCFSDNEPTAQLFDPYKDEETADYFRELADYVSDPLDVRLELLGNNTVKLYVSEAYRAFAAENEIDVFLDLYRYKNAFVVDYLAERFSEAGFTRGYFSSFDGFTRNMDTSDERYSFNLYDREALSIYPAGRFSYSGAQSLVYLRTYPMSQMDMQYYYLYEDGSAVTPYVAPNGYYRAGTDSLVAYSATSSCGEILLSVLPVMMAESFDSSLLKTEAQAGIYSIWYAAETVYYNDPHAQITDLFQKDEVTYKTVLEQG